MAEIDVELTEIGNWNSYLLGHFLDGQMEYPLLVSTARKQWKDLFIGVKSDVAGFYLFQFKDEQAKLQVLEKGPYFFSQKYLVLKDWHRMMKPAKEQLSIIPVWVKFHDLPFELWNQQCLSRVAKQDLPEEVTVVVAGESVIVPIEYQVLPPMCKICHVFGYFTDSCTRKAVSPSQSIKLDDQGWVPVVTGKKDTIQQQSVGSFHSESLQVKPDKSQAVLLLLLSSTAASALLLFSVSILLQLKCFDASVGTQQGWSVRRTVLSYPSGDVPWNVYAFLGGMSLASLWYVAVCARLSQVLHCCFVAVSSAFSSQDGERLYAAAATLVATCCVAVR
ncbi:hypothetical protein RHMOL_Rhmol11G0023400 [Rhododendron molle]|uniref:Uncharacterized protein n=1 Tax=Rhododendron molle TaxID=49168 RepID=A0ACC0LN43_RHOML|nr:hypothetical protein RHMOL_Rhmol11G0023400 [Rhododendron molle]